MLLGLKIHILLKRNNVKAQDMTSCGGTSKETVLRSTFLNILLNMLLYNTKWCNHKDLFWMWTEALNFLVFFLYLFYIPRLRICFLFPPVSVNARNDKEYARALGSSCTRWLMRGDTLSRRGGQGMRKGKWFLERESDDEKGKVIF